MSAETTGSTPTSLTDHIIVNVQPKAGGAEWCVYAGDELVASGWAHTTRDARIEAHGQGVMTALRWLNAEGVLPGD